MAEPAELADVGLRPIKASMLHAFCDVPAFVLVSLGEEMIHWISTESKNIPEGDPCIVRAVNECEVLFESANGVTEDFPVLNVEIHLGPQRLVIAGTHPNSFVSWCTEAIWIDQI